MLFHTGKARFHITRSANFLLCQDLFTISAQEIAFGRKVMISCQKTNVKLPGLKVMVNTHLIATVTAGEGRVVHYKRINIRWILVKIP